MNGQSSYNAKVRASESRAEFTPAMPSAADLGRSQKAIAERQPIKRKRASNPQGGAEARI